MIRIPAIPDGEKRKTLFDFANLSNVTYNRSTVTRDREFGNSVEGGMRVTQTSTNPVTIDIPIDDTFFGKYIRLFFYNHNAYLNTIRVRIYTGDPSEERYYVITISGDVGANQIDVPLAEWGNSTGPNEKEPISRLQLYITNNGQGLFDVTFDSFESCYRKPWVVLVQDGPSLGFIEDVLPMLLSHGLPATIMISHAYMSRLDDPAEREVPLQELQTWLDDPLVSGGLHNDCQQGDFQDFEKAAREHIYSTRRAGLWGSYLHLCALQNNYIDAERWDFLRGFASTMRRGTGIPLNQMSLFTSFRGYGGRDFNYILPTAVSSLASIASISLWPEGTYEDGAAIIDEAIEKQVGAYIYSHGTCRFRPTSCAPVEMYRGIVERAVERSGEIDWLSTEELYTRFANSDRKYLKQMRPSTKSVYTPKGY